MEFGFRIPCIDRRIVEDMSHMRRNYEFWSRPFGEFHVLFEKVEFGRLLLLARVAPYTRREIECSRQRLDADKMTVRQKRKRKVGIALGSQRWCEG